MFPNRMQSWDSSETMTREQNHKVNHKNIIIVQVWSKHDQAVDMEEDITEHHMQLARTGQYDHKPLFLLLTQKLSIYG